VADPAVEAPPEPRIMGRRRGQETKRLGRTG
jgi:hypothetical protein